MNKSRKMQVQAIAIIIGIIILIILALIGIFYTIQHKTQPAGEYITREDAYILAKAMGLPDGRKGDENGEDLTFGELKAMFQDTSELEALIKTLGKQYDEKYTVLKKDFYEVYDLAIEKKGLSDVITQLEITSLGDSSQILTKEGRTLSEKMLATPDAFYPYESSAFSQYHYQTVKAYQKEGILLTIRQVINTEFQIFNAWVMEVQEASFLYFWNDCEITINYDNNVNKIENENSREQVADLSFSEGKLVTVSPKMNKVNGKLLSMKDNQITIDGIGTFPLSEKLKIYQIYDKLQRKYTGDLRIGYNFTDFVIQDGVVEACLITRDEAMKNIRVLVKASNYEGTLHQNVTLTADTNFTVYYGNYDNVQQELFQAGQEVQIDSNSPYFTGERITIVPDALTGKITLNSLQRSQGTPQYRGQIEIIKREDGLAVINEVLLEEYLYCVVPSEMPSSYPLEALKAQAICARTYAYQKMVKSGLPEYGAHVDDSTTYQVYNNIKENAETSKAVRETNGQLLYSGDSLVGAYYYSTSCGFATTADIWKSGAENPGYLVSKRIGSVPEDESINGTELTKEEVFRSYIDQVAATDYESGEAWYRWTYSVPELQVEKIAEGLQKRYGVNAKLVLTLDKNKEYISQDIPGFTSIQDMYIEKRGLGGIADELVLVTDKGTFKVISEHNIRYVLNNGESKIIRQDGSEINSPSLLPSAFFYLDLQKSGDQVVGYQLVGGGFGHGVGMSQNGARSMANQGMNAAQILNFFYDSSVVNTIY